MIFEIDHPLCRKNKSRSALGLSNSGLLQCSLPLSLSPLSSVLQLEFCPQDDGISMILSKQNESDDRQCCPVTGCQLLIDEHAKTTAHAAQPKGLPLKVAAILSNQCGSFQTCVLVQSLV